MSEKVAPPPRVSIVIPMFNVEKYIQTCIDSILCQTFQDFEVIVVDDCSRDRSFEIVQNYSDPRIKLFRQDHNSGSGATMNIGIKNSHGKYISIVDSDDALMPDALQTLFDTAEKSRADVVHMSQFYQALTENFRFGEKFPIKKQVESNLTLGLQNQNRLEWLKSIATPRFSTFYPAWLNFYRSDFLRDRKIFFPEFRDGSYDVFFIFMIICTAEKFVKIDSPLYVYRRMSYGSFTNSVFDIKLERFLSSIPAMLKYIREIFARDDLVIKIPNENQIEITLNIFTMIFKNLTVDVSDRNRIAPIFSRMIYRPDLYTREFITDILTIFCQLLNRSGADAI